MKNVLCKYSDKGKILISEHDDIDDFEHNNDDEFVLNYSKCDNYEKMHKIFNIKNEYLKKKLFNIY